jgi:tetratricopeptide (TPR) repeat protein
MKTKIIPTVCLFLMMLPAQLRAESPSALLEKGIYTEETVGNLDAAIVLYQKVITSAEPVRETVAQAYFRLGKCYLKKGDSKKALDAFETVVREYPSEKTLVPQAQKYLMEIRRKMNTKPLILLPVPWPDGELMRLKVITPAGMDLGRLIYSAQRIGPKPKDLWRIDSYTSIPISNFLQFTRVDAEPDSFAPVYGRTKNTLMGDFQAHYLPGKVELKTEAEGKVTNRSVPIKQVTFDNEEALFLIRRMPLADGYKGSFPIFTVTGGSVIECRIEVTGKEKIKVPAGTFDCYKVDLSCYSEASQILKHHLAFSADKHHYLVRYDTGDAIMELLDIGTVLKNEPVSIQDKDLGISLEAPAGYFLIKRANPNPYKFIIDLLTPELKAWALFSVITRGPESTTPRKTAELDSEVLKTFFKGYTIRNNSWKDLTISGLPAVSFVADYQDKGKAMVEYRTYIHGKSLVYWFVFRIEKDRFEANQAEFDTVVQGLKVK